MSERKSGILLHISSLPCEFGIGDLGPDAYRFELLAPYQLGTGSGRSQYGWRIGAASTGALALILAGRFGWSIA